MTYGFMMMKPRVEIRSAADIDEPALLKQEPEKVKSALSAMLPALAWREEAGGGWFGSFDGDDGWYEFRIGSEPDYIWGVQTSHRASTRKLIGEICRELGLIAFDGQAGMIIDANGERPA
ncbi:hypothetical protein [Terrarubrum flagellatum]|uniref:hypothetical protein n=1 Tax=Terrirubrum flagellatum TaxID=2895980 RepID=UPI0031453E93